MSDKTLKINDEILIYLDDGLRKPALEFAVYLNANQMMPKLWRPESKTWLTPYKEWNICMIQFEPNQWKVTFFFGDYNGEFDDGLFTTAVQEHVQICTSCHGSCIGGMDTVIFGKAHTNACSQLTIQFTNPSSNELEHINKLVEYKKTAPDSISFFADE